VTRLVRKLALAALILVATPSSRAADIGTAFSYQGHLEKGSPPGPVNATCDFRFGLWDALTGGNQKGASPQTVAGVSVSGGDFRTSIDFGAGAIDGTARWLAIEVKCPGNASFLLRVPRQELTPAPYSIRAGEGVGPPNTLEIDPVTGYVGIGTTTPQTHLDINASVPRVRWSDTESDDFSILADGNDFLLRDETHAQYLAAFNNSSAQIFTGGTTRLAINSSGDVGIGTTTPAAQLDVNGAARTTTLEITGGSPLVQSLVGWGRNVGGEIDVPTGTFTAVAAGLSHSLGIRSDGTLAGWGLNGDGQTNVPGGIFTAVAAGGFHSLGIRSDGTLAGWGDNFYGQTNVPSGTFTAVAGGLYHSLAIRSDGTLAGWGNNGDGQITVPAGTFTALAAGRYHSLGIRSDGTLVVWGLNTQGGLNVPSGTFTAVAAAAFHGLAIRSDGTLAQWGFNIGTPPSGTFTAVAASFDHSLAIRSDGTLAGWGCGIPAFNDGQCNVPMGTFTAVAAGLYHSLAIRSEGSAALVLHNDSAYKPGTNTWTILSDRRLKKNIEPLSGALERLLQLRGVTFQWLYPSSQGGITGTQMGLIADEVSRAFPQWVGRDPKGYQTLTVGGFEALTAEALRELRAEKDRQLSEKDCEMEELRSEIENLKELMRALGKRQ